MTSYLRGLALALMAAGLCVAPGAPASAGCVGLSGTADGFDKETAVSRAQLALADYIKQYKTEEAPRLGLRQPNARSASSLIGVPMSAITCSTAPTS